MNDFCKDFSLGQSLLATAWDCLSEFRGVSLGVSCPNRYRKVYNPSRFACDCGGAWCAYLAAKQRMLKRSTLRRRAILNCAPHARIWGDSELSFIRSFQFDHKFRQERSADARSPRLHKVFCSKLGQTPSQFGETDPCFTEWSFSTHIITVASDSGFGSN